MIFKVIKSIELRIFLVWPYLQLIVYFMWIRLPKHLFHKCCSPLPRFEWKPSVSWLCVHHKCNVIVKKKYKIVSTLILDCELCWTLALYLYQRKAWITTNYSLPSPFYITLGLCCCGEGFGKTHPLPARVLCVYILRSTFWSQGPLIAHWLPLCKDSHFLVPGYHISPADAETSKLRPAMICPNTLTVPYHSQP